MKVLIISQEVWQDGTNGGNVLSNIFSDTGYEFAQIYCSPGVPQNNLCTNYYQMTDGQMIRNFLNHQPVGNIFELRTVAEERKNSAPTQVNVGFYSFFHRHKFGIFYAARNFLWEHSNWKNNQLKAFVDDFAPDIIFAPCYANVFMQQLTRFIAERTGKKVISYISDDNYTLKQFSLSPYFWMNRFAVRKELRKTFPYYSLVYTMTEVQKCQCERDFHANMKILLKAVDPSEVPEIQPVHEPIRMVYAGGIYLNRWKTLAKIAEAIRAENQNGKRIQLDIYTGNEITREMAYKLNDGCNSIIHPSISQEELKKVYSQSDIALHVESFDLKNRLLTRMSFSTKIVDCLASSCAVMAICDEKQGGYEYLKRNDIAICIPNVSKAHDVIHELLLNPAYIMEYKKKAKSFCLVNLEKKKQTTMIIQDFEMYV